MAKRHHRHRASRGPKVARPAQQSYRPVDHRVPPLVRDVRAALGARTPYELMALASGLVEVNTPRPTDRWRGDDGRADHVDFGELLESFVRSEFPAMTNLARAMLPMIADDVVGRRTARLLAESPAVPMPAWLTDLAEISIEGTVEMVHVLGDGDNVLVAWRWRHGGGATAVVYIDHNVGGIVKDAFVLPLPLERTVEEFRRIGNDPDQVLRPLDPADARARVEAAIRGAEITMPPFESDTWPVCRPLVDWVVSKLPPGGSDYERPEWTEAERDALLDRFVASSFGRGVGLDDAVVRELADPLVWFACDYGPGDPLRWSPVSVEIVLTDWYERKILGNRTRMRDLPRVLAAFVRFAHAEREIRPSLTDETLEAVERWTPVYLASLKGPPRSPFQGARDLALIAAGLDPDDVDDDGFDDLDDLDDLDGRDYRGGFDLESLVAEFHQSLEDEMGGPEAIARLDDEPLPDEQFDWSVVPPEVHDEVATVLEAIDRVCDAALDVELRTVSRRLLARLVQEDVAPFVRSPHHERLAAGIVAVACFDNGVFRRGRRSFFGFGVSLGVDTQKGLAEAMGVPPSSVSQRAQTVRNALQLRQGAFDAALAHSSRRRWYLEQYERTANWPPGGELDDDSDG
jgi:hypothetical protein